MKLEDMINTIQLGDCYELIKQIPDKSIDLVYIDIPYLYNEGGAGTSDLATRATKKRMILMGTKEKHADSLIKNTKNSEALRIAKNKAKNDKDIVNIQNGIDWSILDELCRVMKRIYIYIWCSKKQILDLMKYFIDGYDCIFEIFTWHKTNPTPTHNNCYPPDTEYCLLFREKGTGMGGTMETLKKWHVSPANVRDKKFYNHPTIKPLEIVKNHIINSSKENDIVLDCFCGSGTTCVAAKELGRRYIGMEIDPEYHKIAVDRLNGITANGQTSIFTDFDNL
jgi:DNA modification methylase